MNKGLPERLLYDFPNTVPEIRPEIILSKDDKLIDMNYWIAGFVEGEGCFFVKTSKSKTHKLGLSVNLNFIIVLIQMTINDTIEHISKIFSKYIYIYISNFLFS